MKSIFFIPIDKPNADYSKILYEISKKVILCEKNGFQEAFFGEHLTDKHEKLSSSLMMISALSLITQNIRLGTMTINLPFYHPSVLASLISTADNLAKGRLLLGIGSGSNQTDIEATNILDKDNYKLMLESIDLIIKLLRSKNLVNLKTKNYRISTSNTGNLEQSLGFFGDLYKKRQDLEVIMPALGLNSNNIKVCAKKNWSFLSTNFCEASILKNHINNYIKFSNLEKRFTINKIKISRFIFVCDSKKDVDKYLYAENSPYLYMTNVIFQKLKKYNKHYIFGNNVTNVKEALKNIVISGNIDQVNDKISSLKDNIGPFRNLVYIATPSRKNSIYDDSLELFGKYVNV